MPARIEIDPAQLLQPLPIRDVTRQIHDFEPLRQRVAAHPASVQNPPPSRPLTTNFPTDLSSAAGPLRSDSVRPFRLFPGTASKEVQPRAVLPQTTPSRRANAETPSPTKQIIPDQAPVARPAHLELAERNVLPERLYQLLNENRGRNEFDAVARRIKILGGQPLPPTDAIETAPAEVALFPESTTPAAPGVRPLREISTLAASPERSRVLEIITTADTIRQSRAREVLAALTQNRAADTASGIRQILIDKII